MFTKISLSITFAVLALIAIWLDDSFILFGIVIAAALFLYFLYLQGKVSFGKEAGHGPDDDTAPKDPKQTP
ncbi:MAG: hypothetical protein HOK98_10045 [Rhodospirillaceae bacterium]|jgi:hypothetical protein|nr:hypothetical protein [Rhodospirillaceae bacterium]MBT5944850.1 hypothetical protein [Rhodospirillaceae bacterium]MBT6404013.1 hypothetical protein [Rhodospirillaceae bacterium]MBT6536515.1 hypothetical protein [Rhodospirillaceae bacterium]MBT7362269.1 hypothetical protein [Rhodospirillaceae bacterium]